MASSIAATTLGPEAMVKLVKAGLAGPVAVIPGLASALTRLAEIRRDRVQGVACGADVEDVEIREVAGRDRDDDDVDNRHEARANDAGQRDCLRAGQRHPDEGATSQSTLALRNAPTALMVSSPPVPAIVSALPCGHVEVRVGRCVDQGAVTLLAIVTGVSAAVVT